MYHAALATDYASVRIYDRDGRLHVARSNISKACVNPYWAEEIPDWRALGLRYGTKCMMYRHPAELAKAASTFNGLPLLQKHVAVSAEDHDHDVVVGATGSDARFSMPFLTNRLVIWTAPAIRAVEDGSCRELSCAYAYEADMTPGTTPDGERYDGVMRNIHANHVALVPRGRAGRDVLVSDGFTITEAARRRHSLTRSHERII